MSVSCRNYGTPINSTTCACPPGFGNLTCAQPACGGTIFQGSSRPLVPAAAFPNVTAANCQCQSGWAGLGCNVCQTSEACSTGFTAAGGTNPSDPSSALVPSNNTMVCSRTSRVYSASQMSCNVLNPTLQALFPEQSFLNLQRSRKPSLTPIQNVTASGQENTLTAQLFYGGVEQFACKADSCVQTLNSSSTASSDYECNNLNCTCNVGGTFCKPGATTDLTNVINALAGTVSIACAQSETDLANVQCTFKQNDLVSLFGPDGLSLSGCMFGECVRQNVIDTDSGSNSSGAAAGSDHLDGGVIAGLAVVGTLVGLALVLLGLGLAFQRKARRAGTGKYLNGKGGDGGVGIEWVDVGYSVPAADASIFNRKAQHVSNHHVILDRISGSVPAGHIMAILGPSGSGKTTLVETLAGKKKSGRLEGSVAFPVGDGNQKYHPNIGFVPQKDVLPATLTVFEATLFAARLRLPEYIPDDQKIQRVEEVIEQLGISHIRNARIGDDAGSKGRGISGGEMRRVSIGLELVANPDVLILDEPTSGLDSVSAAKVAKVLYDVAHGEHPVAVVASIHQPSSQLYEIFDDVCVLSHGHALYSGPGGQAPVDSLQRRQGATLPPLKEHYNVADYLLEVATDPPAALFLSGSTRSSSPKDGEVERKEGLTYPPSASTPNKKLKRRGYNATFLTQFEVLAGREWKILQRDRTLFLTHIGLACVLGVFVGGLYYKTDISISGFQSRIGCLFFLGALTAFSALSALYNVVESRPLFIRERSNDYYSPTAWLMSKFIFDVIPLRLIPTIIVSSVTYWMAGLAPDAAHFFKFLFIMVLYTLAMALFNFLLATSFQNGGIAILISALSALYQMTFAGFFVHLQSIPQALRWLQWFCPLKYMLEALSVNEVGSGLQIQDTLQGVPVNIQASVILDLLFAFGQGNYYRDVLVLFAFIAGFAIMVIFSVWFKLRETR